MSLLLLLDDREELELLLLLLEVVRPVEVSSGVLELLEHDPELEVEAMDESKALALSPPSEPVPVVLLLVEPLLLLEGLCLRTSLLFNR